MGQRIVVLASDHASRRQIHRARDESAPPERSNLLSDGLRIHRIRYARSEQLLERGARAATRAPSPLWSSRTGGELHAHCYRMLGSVHDAEDALQDALLRAWRGLATVRGPQLAALVAVHDRHQQLPEPDRAAAQARAADRLRPGDRPPRRRPGEPVVESVWIEPYPDELLGLEDGFAAPEARYEQRESVELAFVAALQHLPANQRAVLILREVLGFSAKEVAETLETTVASVNSALQRARKPVDERVPEQSQQATLRALGDERAARDRRPLRRRLGACDVEAFAAMLAEDATFAMPPLRSWFGGRDGDRELAWPAGRCRALWRWRVRSDARQRAAGARLLRLERGRAELPAVRAQRADAPRRADQ